VHDLSGWQYLVFYSSGTDELLPVVGLSSYSDSLQWQTQYGTQFRLIATLSLLVVVKQNPGISGILQRVCGCAER